MKTKAISETKIIMVESNDNVLNSLEDIPTEYSRSVLTSPDLPPAFTESLAVSVRNGFKCYRKGAPVLSDFNMTVPTGTIYSLLGSSGCGKTTLLSCCVGILNLDRGDIQVFGHKPGTKESGVPGRRVGFMPQELSVYEQLTIQESLTFYGRIYGMQRDHIHESVEFLVDFLDLPSASRIVSTLSGGQKRRVSMALALIHDPELLILDEPTVGVDPLLRENIWSHLLALVSSGRTTVIITTHYVEEARQSNLIGMMRNGRLLTEDSPQALLKQFNTNLLEDIVLSLSRIDREQRKNASGQAADGSCENGQDEENPKERTVSAYKSRLKKGQVETTLVEESALGLRCPHSLTNVECNMNGNMSSGHTIKSPPPQKFSFRRRTTLGESIRKTDSTPIKRLVALLIKNYIILMRNIGVLLFTFFVPAIQVILVCLAIGSDPRGLEIGVINPESCDFEGENWRHKVVDECPLDEDKKGILSCFYLAHLPVDAFILEREATEASALTKIEKGYTYGYIAFPEGFTRNVICQVSRLCGGDDISGSKIIFELDMSSKQIGSTIKRIFLETYVKAMDQIKVNCKETLSEEAQAAASVPYTFKKPVYGKDDFSFIGFLAPSILTGLLFFFPLCSSAVPYITEKKMGTLDRALVAGVRTAELMGGFLIFQVGILLIQTGISLVILMWVFKMEIVGSLVLTVILTVMVGGSGMSCGFLIGMFCTEEVQAVQLAMGTFFPNAILAGMIWPLEGMHKYLQYVSYLLPCTLALESMRSIVNRGWTLTHRIVWSGFVSTFAWITVYWILALLVHKYQRRR